MDLLKVDNIQITKKFGYLPDYFWIAQFRNKQLLQHLCVWRDDSRYRV